MADYHTSSPEPFDSNILGDIETYEVLLRSVNDSTCPDGNLRDVYEAKLTSLRQQLGVLDPAHSWDAILSETSSQQRAGGDGSRATSFEDEASSTTSGQVLHTIAWPDVDVKHESSNNSSAFSSVDRVSAVRSPAVEAQNGSRKRPLSSHQVYSLSKARRAGFSPATSRPTTPVSTSEFDDVLGTLLGSDFKDDLLEYEQEQRLWDVRWEQERRDEELARSIQESWGDTNSLFGPEPSPSMETSLGWGATPPTRMLPPPLPEPKVEASTSYQLYNVKTEPSMSPYSTLELRTRSEGSTGRNGSSNSSTNEVWPSPFMGAIKSEPMPGDMNGYTSWNDLQSMTIPQPGSSFYGSPTNSSLRAGYGQYSSYGIPQSYPSLPEHNSSLEKAPNSFSLRYQDLKASQSSRFSSLDGLSRALNPPDHGPVQQEHTNTQKELKSLLSNIRPDEEVSPGTREGTPESMKCNLMEHQKVGLAWMKKMEEASSRGGILADDMGLGKTVQALALIVSRRSADPACKTTLIVAPVALMSQWAREISKLLKGGKHALTVDILHGNSRDLPWHKIREKDVVLTTYGTLTSEMKRKQLWEEKVKRVPNATPSRPNECIPLLGEKSKWYRIILDEAQWIKNRSAKASIAASYLQARYRWCLTGTPMQNSIDELYSLIRFLRIAPYRNWEAFNRDFARPLKAKSSYEGARKDTMKQLQALCRAIMLRRTKDSRIDGQPILQLPAKTIQHQHAIFSKDEQEFYGALEGRAQITFNRFLQAGTVGRNYSNVLVLLLRLRQACCHPHLIKDLELETGAAPETIDKLANARLLLPNVVERIKQIEAFECPICFDAAINSLIFNPCGHPSCNECFDRLATQAAANTDGEHGAGILCPSCRTKIDPAKLTDFQSVKTAFGFDSAGDEEGRVEELLTGVIDEDSDSDLSSEASDSGDEIDSRGNLLGFVVADEDDGQDGSVQAPEKTAVRKKAKGKARASSAKHLSLAQLRKEGLKNKAAKKRYLRRLEKKFQTSAKIDRTMEILSSIDDRGTNEKTIIFSQFTSLLDLLEVPLSRKDVQYKRYDGSMKRSDRDEAVVAFTDEPRCTVLLVSLKAGNSGLNLTAASQVIIFDPHWNWYTEAQAIDRAHRIGQMRPVEVHRLLVTDTVEDRILALQDKKKKLIETALDENAAKNVGRLGVRELGYLFGVNSM